MSMLQDVPGPFGNTALALATKGRFCCITLYRHTSLHQIPHEWFFVYLLPVWPAKSDPVYCSDMLQVATTNACVCCLQKVRTQMSSTTMASPVCSKSDSYRIDTCQRGTALPSALWTLLWVLFDLNSMATTKLGAEILLENGADAHAIDHYQRTPYELHRGSRFLNSKTSLVDLNIHEAFKGEHQVRARRKKGGRKLTPEERAEAQKTNDRLRIEEQKKIDQESHDALVEKANNLYLGAKGAAALGDTASAVDKLYECLTLDPNHFDALKKLRELAANDQSSDKSQRALSSLLHEGGGSLNLADSATNIVEARAMFKVMDASRRGWLSFSQLESKLGDFGMSPHEIEVLYMLMDANVDGHVGTEEFCAGYIKLKQSIEGETVKHDLGLRLTSKAHSIHTKIVDDKYEHIMAEKYGKDPNAPRTTPAEEETADVLWVGGIPGYLMDGTQEEANEALTQLCEPFGFVMASTAHQKLRKENGSWGLVKFAMPCSVQEAMETGITIARSSTGGDDVNLKLGSVKQTNTMTKIRLRNLALLTKGHEEEAAEYIRQATANKIDTLWIGDIPNAVVEADDAAAVDAAVKTLVTDLGGEITAITVTKKRKNDSWALIQFTDAEPVNKAVEEGLIAKDCTFYDPKKSVRVTKDVTLRVEIATIDTHMHDGGQHENLRVAVASQEAQAMFHVLDKSGVGHLSSYKLQMRLVSWLHVLLCPFIPNQSQTVGCGLCVCTGGVRLEL